MTTSHTPLQIAGHSKQSLESSLLEEHMDHNGDVTDDESLSSVAGSVYAAGSDTVRSLRQRRVFSV